MDMKKIFMTAIGVAAFIIGGIITREKTLEGIETLEKVFSKKSDDAPTEA